jgi:hypothetical protein
MESEPQSLNALLRGSPWYESAIRGARAERAVVLWVHLGARQRLEGFVGQVVNRDGSLVGGPLIGGTVWSLEHGGRGPVLDERRQELEAAWAEVERRLAGSITIVGHRFASIRSRLLAGAPISMRGALMGATWVDLHEAASLLRRSRLADATGRGSLLEVKSASLHDLAAIAGERASDETIAGDDLRAAEVATAIWTRVLLPRFARIPVTSDESVTPEEAVPVERRVGRLPDEIARILDTPLDEPEELVTYSDPLASRPPAAVADPAPLSVTPPTARRLYSGQPDADGWLVVREDGRRLDERVLSGHALARAIVADLAGGEPDPGVVERLLDRVVAQLPARLPFAIDGEDARAISA